MPRRVLLRMRMRDGEFNGRERWVIWWDGQLFSDFLEFLRDKRFDPPTERDYAYAIGSFLEWLDAVSDTKNLPEGDERRRFLKRWAHALEHGTVLRDGSDPTGLWWRGMGLPRVSRLLSKFTTFAEWLTQQRGHDTILLEHSSPAGLIRFWRSFDKSKASQLLGFGIRNPASPDRLPFHRNRAFHESVQLNKLHAFPEWILPDLLTKGLARPRAATHPRAPYHEKYDVQSQLVVLLMHYGGLRVSSVFHLWVGDIELLEADNIRVRVFHPAWGKVTHRGQVMNRREYLALHGMVPLDEEIGSKRNGWKDLLITDAKSNSSVVIITPATAMREIRFAYEQHLEHTRRVRDQAKLGHPFLFVKKNGAPMTAKDFQKIHNRALVRLGYLPNTIDGLDNHGHRHSYAHRLAAAGVPEKIIQLALHHSSIYSQQAYKQKSEFALYTEVMAHLETTPMRSTLLQLH